MYYVIALLVFAACAEPPSAPRVRLVVADGSPVLSEYEEAPQAWSVLGFDIALDDGTTERECPRRWYEMADVDCQITITIVRGYVLERYGSNAVSDLGLRGVFIDFRLTEYADLMSAMAHEVGHILLDTSRHTRGGIMGGQGWRMFAPWPDKQLACETIHICVE